MHREPVLLSRLFLLCFIANLVQATAFSLFVHFPGFLHELGAAPTLIGVIMALGAATAVAGAPLVGRALDARGRRAVVLFGSALNVATCAGFLFVDRLGVPVVVLNMLHSGAGMALHVALFTYAVDAVPTARRTQGLAVFGVSALGSVGLGAALGDLVYVLEGYPGIFLASLGLSVVAGLIATRLPETRQTHHDDGAPSGVLALLRRRELVTLWLMIGAFFFSMASVFVYLKTLVLETGIGSVGLFFALYSGVAVVLRLFFGWVPDRLGPARLAPVTLLVYAVGLVLLGTAASTAQFCAAALLAGLGHGFGYPILLGLVTSRVGDRSRGSAVSAYGAIDDGAGLVAAPVLGLLIDASGYPATYALAAGLVVIAVTVHQVRASRSG